MICGNHNKRKKGTIGAGRQLKEIIKEHNNAGVDKEER